VNDDPWKEECIVLVGKNNRPTEPNTEIYMIQIPTLLCDRT
jgi:hypothetical protein